MICILGLNIPLKHAFKGFCVITVRQNQNLVSNKSFKHVQLQSFLCKNVCSAVKAE